MVERDGHGFTRGDLVTATVRRSCRHCLACSEGFPDSCLTGDYVERGITRLNGFARELVVEDPAQLVAIPRSLGRLGVLAEPASICERALRHARAIGNRQPWELQRALVLGAGAVGTLSTYLLRLAGVEVWTASLEPSNDLVTASGAHYVSLPGTPLSGARRLRPGRRGRRRRAVDGRHARPPAPQRRRVPARHRSPGAARASWTAGRSALDAILENRVLFGSVNAAREDWLAAVADLDRARERWPDELEQFVSLRVPLDRFEDAFAHRGGKATLVLSD